MVTEKHKTCFLVDDDLDDQEIFAMALQQVNASIRCVFANDGIEAMDKLQHEKAFIPDYIFLDLNMPRMDGRQCLIEIRRQSHLRDIPLAIYSTSSDEGFQLEMKNLGATTYIVKPSQMSLLRKTLNDFFSHY
jgi:CheY-like chemotaxis protein